MLARQLVDPSLQWLSEAKVITVQREDLVGTNRFENPFRKSNLNPLNTSHKPVRPMDMKAIDHSETPQVLLAPGADVCSDPCARQSLERRTKRDIVFPSRSAVREDKQIVSRYANPRTDGLIISDSVHQLRNAIQKNVLVVNRGQPQHAGSDFNVFTVVFVPTHLCVRGLRKREERMLQMRHDVFENRVNYIADEKTRISVPYRQKLFVRIRGFSDHPDIFGVSMTMSR